MLWRGPEVAVVADAMIEAGHGSAMLAWGFHSGVGGAYDNTLIPEWQCPVKRPL